MFVNDGIILAFIVMGIVLIMASFFWTKYDRFIQEAEQGKKEKNLDDQADYDEVRNKILELNEYGEYLKAELEKKHKELLFLYQMIIEKQKEMQIESLKVDLGDPQKMDGAKVTPRKLEGETGKSPGSESGSVEKRNYNKEILDMSLAGYSVSEIAKKLHIGVGQVELVLNLYR